MKIKAKVAFVTGGAGAIGGEIARQLSRKGLSVALADFDGKAARALAEKINKEPDKCMACEIDVSKKESVDQAVALAKNALGEIDVLVNCAGIYPNSLVREMTEEEWDRVVDINLKGAFLTCRAVMPDMRQRRFGKIINIASNHAFKGGAKAAHYSASKAGVIAFSKSLALELAPDGINVNVVSPGLTDTPMPHRVLSDAHLAERAKANPLGRLGTPKDIADAVMFFVSEKSRYITGQTLCVNGGDLMP